MGLEMKMVENHCSFNTDSRVKGLTMGPHVISQQSLCSIALGTVRTLEPLTYSIAHIERLINSVKCEEFYTNTKMTFVSRSEHQYT